MKRILLLILFFLLFSIPSDAEDMNLARMTAVIAGGGGSAAAAACPANESNALLSATSNTSTSAALDAANYSFIGQADFDPGANWTVCAVLLSVHYHGTTDANVQIEIRAMSGTGLSNPPAAGCTSDAIAVTADDTNYKFTGLNCDMNSGTTYGIVATRASGSDSAAVFHIGSAGGISGTNGYWKADYSNNYDDTNDMYMIVYGATR